MLSALDVSVFQFLNGLAHRSGFLDLVGIFLAVYLPYLVGLAAVILILLERNWRQRFYNFLFGSLSLLLSYGLVTPFIRFFYDRPRPSLALPDAVILITKNLSEPSFPSGHAVFFFALAAAFYFIDRRWFKYFLITAFLISLARIFVGVHYPLDVVVGALIGWLGVLAVRRLLPRLT